MKIKINLSIEAVAVLRHRLSDLMVVPEAKRPDDGTGARLEDLFDALAKRDDEDRIALTPAQLDWVMNECDLALVCAKR